MTSELANETQTSAKEVRADTGVNPVPAEGGTSCPMPGSKMSRLVVEAKGTTVDAWLNGRHLGRFSTSTNEPGVVALIAADQDVQPALVKLSRLVGFVAV